MHHDTDARSKRSVRATQHSLEVHIGKLVKVLLDMKEQERKQLDLERVRSLALTSKQRAHGLRGMKEKLLPPPVQTQQYPESPYSKEAVLLLPDVKAIIAIRGYDLYNGMRGAQFAQVIVAAVSERSATDKSIRDAIVKFLRIYPAMLPAKRGPS